MSFLAKQPNGLYCSYDDIDDQPKKWNITKEEYIEKCAENARKEAIEKLKKAKNFNVVIKNFMADDNMTKDGFDKFLKEVGFEK